MLFRSVARIVATTSRVEDSCKVRSHRVKTLLSFGKLQASWDGRHLALSPAHKGRLGPPHPTQSKLFAILPKPLISLFLRPLDACGGQPETGNRLTTIPLKGNSLQTAGKLRPRPTIPLTFAVVLSAWRIWPAVTGQPKTAQPTLVTWLLSGEKPCRDCLPVSWSS